MTMTLRGALGALALLLLFVVEVESGALTTCRNSLLSQWRSRNGLSPTASVPASVVNSCTSICCARLGGGNCGSIARRLDFKGHMIESSFNFNFTFKGEMNLGHSPMDLHAAELEVLMDEMMLHNDYDNEDEEEEQEEAEQRRRLTEVACPSYYNSFYSCNRCGKDWQDGNAYGRITSGGESGNIYQTCSSDGQCQTAFPGADLKCLKNVDCIWADGVDLSVQVCGTKLYTDNSGTTVYGQLCNQDPAKPCCAVAPAGCTDPTLLNGYYCTTCPSDGTDECALASCTGCYNRETKTCSQSESFKSCIVDTCPTPTSQTLSIWCGEQTYSDSRCGKSWDDASSKCQPKCSADSDCDAALKCYQNVDTTPCFAVPSPSVPPNSYLCASGMYVTSVTLRTGGAVNQLVSFTCSDGSTISPTSYGSSSGGTLVTVPTSPIGICSLYYGKLNSADAVAGLSFLSCDGSWTGTYGSGGLTSASTHPCPSALTKLSGFFASESGSVLTYSGFTTICSEPTPPDQLSTSGYIGCYADNGGGKRDLPFLAMANGAEYFSCKAECESLSYRYFGLQNSRACYCGNSYGSQGSSGKCDARCVADKTQTCGGVDANSVYATGPPTPVPTPAPTSAPIEQAHCPLCHKNGRGYSITCPSCSSVDLAHGDKLLDVQKCLLNYCKTNFPLHLRRRLTSNLACQLFLGDADSYEKAATKPISQNVLMSNVGNGRKAWDTILRSCCADDSTLTPTPTPRPTPPTPARTPTPTPVPTPTPTPTPSGGGGGGGKGGGKGKGK